MALNSHSLDLEASSSQYAYVADNAALSITGDITIEAWVKLEQLPSTFGTTFTIASKWDAVPATSYIMNISTSDNKIGFYYSGDGTNFTFLNSNAALGAPDVGAWVHLAVAVDVSTKTADYYKNGSSVGMTYQSGVETAIHNNTSNFAVSAYNTKTTPIQFFDGLIDEVRVWSVIRSSGEISANYQSHLVGNETNLAGYWRFNNNYNDTTSNASNLTAVNTPVFSTNAPFVGTPDARSLFFQQI